MFGQAVWTVDSVQYASKDDIPLAIIIPAVILPMVLFIALSIYCYRSVIENVAALANACFVRSHAEFHFHQEEEPTGGAGVREGQTSAGESGGKRPRSLQEGVHRYGFTPEGRRIR